MREIKFRAWDKEGKKIEYTPGVKRSEDWLAPEINSLIEHCQEEENYILMQYTGLKDKNGKEIYEGDIVKGTFYANQPEISAIEWFDKLAGFTFSKYPMNIHGLHGLEVIGNIYENPELISVA